MKRHDLVKLKYLHDSTGCSMRDCMKAEEYANGHNGIIPLDYLMAISIPINLKHKDGSKFSFDEIVEYHSLVRMQEWGLVESLKSDDEDD